MSDTKSTLEQVYAILNPDPFSQVLSELISDTGLSVEAVSDQTKIPISKLSHWLNGNTVPSDKMKIRIIKKIGKLTKLNQEGDKR